jgi:DNA-binding response OmpR family regulator
VKGLRLKFGGGILDLDRGEYTKGRNEITIPSVQLKLLKRLAAAGGEHGWLFVERGELVMHLWGEDFEKEPSASVERLRKVRTRMRETLGVEITEIRMEGARHNPSYRLLDDVKLVE